MNNDMIMNPLHMPTFEEMKRFMSPNGYSLWDDMNSFITEHYHAIPKMAYSSCSGKPGWNVKYKKSGKSICTLYPEKDGFVALVVITLELAEIIKSIKNDLSQETLSLILNAKPFNGTLWLMISVYDEPALDDIKQLLLIKHRN